MEHIDHQPSSGGASTPTISAGCATADTLRLLERTAIARISDKSPNSTLAALERLAIRVALLLHESGCPHCAAPANRVREDLLYYGQLLESPDLLPVMESVAGRR
jgi:hypothetical protein